MAKRILIADDSVTIQKAFALTFAGEDVSIASARSADEGLALARQARPDLIIADGAMPGRTGYDLCAQVRADATLSGIPVYILASSQQPYDETRGTSAGADGHLLKPGTRRPSWKGSTRRPEGSRHSQPRLRPRAHHRGVAPRLGHGGRRLRRDQHRFVRPGDAASDRHRRPGRGRCPPPQPFVPARYGDRPPASARDASVPDSRHAPRRHAPGRPGTMPVRPLGGRPRRRRAFRPVRRLRRSDGR